MQLFHTLGDFLSDKLEINFLLTSDGKAFVSYLADIFEKLNILNKELQGSKETLADENTKIFGFITNIDIRNNKNFE